MRRYNSNSTIKNRIIRDVMKEVGPLLEHDWTSSEAAMMADRYGELHLSSDAKRWRDFADELKDKEQSQDYDDVIDVKSMMSFFDNKKRFILATYIPAKMNILMYFGNNNKIAIVRLTPQGTKEIYWQDIIQSIASLYKREHVKKNGNCASVSKSLRNHRKEAKELCAEIKKVFGYDLSWRFFSVTGSNRVVKNVFIEKAFNIIEIKNDILSEENNYTYMPEGEVDSGNTLRYSRAVFDREFYMFILKDMTINEKNSQYFIYIGNMTTAIVFRIKAYRNKSDFYHSLQPGPANEYLRHFNLITSRNRLSIATKETSHIDNIYNFFKSRPKDERDAFFAYLSKCISSNVSFKDVREYYNIEHNNIVKKKKDELHELDLDGKGNVIVSTVDNTPSDDINADDDTIVASGDNSAEDFV